jgi:ribosome-associated heat shock protein Hsp15
MTGVRLDKWLWAARFFKTRSLATQHCDLGRVQLNTRPVKPAREIHVGDTLHIKNEGGDFEVKVLLLSDLRGPATVAQTLYEVTAASREARAKVSAERRMVWLPEADREGKPSKRDRRELDKLKGGRRF